jgi:hypothetical protein
MPTKKKSGSAQTRQQLASRGAYRLSVYAYDETLEGLKTLSTRWGVESRSEVIARLVAYALAHKVRALAARSLGPPTRRQRRGRDPCLQGAAG